MMKFSDFFLNQLSLKHTHMFVLVNAENTKGNS